MTQRISSDLNHGINAALAVLNEVCDFVDLADEDRLDAYGEHGGDTLSAYKELLDRISGKAERAMQTISEAFDSDEPTVTQERT